MSTTPDPALLDAPVWHALRGPQAAFALSAPGAARFPPDVSPFSAVEDPDDPAHWAALAGLAGAEERLALVAPTPLTAPDGWGRVLEIPALQMVAPEGDAAAESSDVVALGAPDVPEMLALAAATEPGPFAHGTVGFGGYLGVRRDGELVAMAGTRLNLPGWREISAVCTRADHRGQGLSRLLVGLVAERIRRDGERAFLHVMADNTAAAGLYRSMGFSLRAEVVVTVVRTP